MKKVKSVKKTATSKVTPKATPKKASIKKSRLSVETENILPIIKKWLYSQKEIFLRELVSNAFDAIIKLKKTALIEDVRDSDDSDYAIDIRIERSTNQLIIEDNGIGMDSKEIEKYIANIAFSGAKDFMKQYEQSEGSRKDGIIGHFGLGFYSSFMVADKVCVDSLSWQKTAKPTQWESDGGVEYEISSGKRKKRGTTITLTLNEENREFLDKARINDLVRQFLDFLPMPIRVDGAEVNRQNALWTQAPSSLKKKDYEEFYKYLYPYQGEPLFYVHLNVDYPFPLQGILFFPRLGHEMDLNRSNVKIYCKQVFVSDEAQDLIPKYLTVLQGVIDMPDLPLNVSRSYLQNEPQVRKIATHVVKKVADRLNEEFQKNPKDYERIWQDIAPFVKYAMMNDEQFYEKASSSLIFRMADTSEQAEASFTTLDDYEIKHKGKIEKKVYYANDLKSQSGQIEMLKKQGIDTLILDAVIDSHFAQFLEMKREGTTFVRVDSEISDHILDKKANLSLAGADGKDAEQNLKELFQKSIPNDKITYRVESLLDETIPAMVLLPEQMRRLQEMSLLNKGATAFEFPIEHTLVINSKNPLIQSLAKPGISLENGKSDKRIIAAVQIYYLARIAQGGAQRSDIEALLQSSFRVLGYLF